jgi:fructose-1,6-bisphosphatase/inositol monophosphatase family enzyme
MKLENRIMERKDFEQFALPLTQSLATYIKQERSSINVEIKMDQSLVTNLDKEVELRIRDAFSNKFEDLSIIGEEFGDVKGSSVYSLCIDPIDGTSAFVDKGFDYAISIGILKNGNPHFGLVYDVAEDVYYMNGKTNLKEEVSDIILTQGNPLVESLDYGSMNSRYVKGFSTALGIVRSSTLNLRAYVQTSNNLKLWDVAGALGHLKFCESINVDFLKGKFNGDSHKFSGFVIHKKNDFEFDNWFNRNKKNLIEML